MPAPRPSPAAIKRAIDIWTAYNRGPWRLVLTRDGDVIVDAATESAQPAPKAGGNSCDEAFGVVS